MKNLTKIFMAVAVAMFAFACVTDTTEDLGIEVDKGGVTEITVSLEESRTQLGERDADGEYPLYWSEGDAIAVNGVASTPLAASYNGQVAASFTFQGVLTAPYSVVYPAPAEGVTAAEGLQPITFLAVQPYTEGTFASGAAPMYGYATEGANVELHHLTGVFRFAVKGSDKLASLTLTAEGKIAGNFDIDCTSGALTAHEDASNTVTVTFAEPLVLGEVATPIYVAVPAGSHGLYTITLTSTDGKAMVVKYDSDAKPVKVGIVKEFGEILYTPSEVTAPEGELVISSEAEMKNLALLAEKEMLGNVTKVTVAATIDMSGVADWQPIAGFPAIEFDGGSDKGYEIKGLTSALFDTVTGATIKNVKLTGANITETERLHIGALVCDANGATINNCSAAGTLTYNNTTTTIVAGGNTTYGIGGIVGCAYSSTVSNCSNGVDLIMQKYAVKSVKENGTESNSIYCGTGGVIGLTSGDTETTKVRSTVSNCTNVGNITVLAHSSGIQPTLGGVIGYCYYSNVSNVVNGEQDADDKGCLHVEAKVTCCAMGGIAGLLATVDIDTATNYGDVKFDKGADYPYVGAAFGTLFNSTGTVKNVDNYGTLSVPNVAFSNGTPYFGGVIGRMANTKWTIDDCDNYADLVIEANFSAIKSNNMSCIGAIIGGTEGGTVKNCDNYANLSVKGTFGKVSDATNYGGSLYVGGIVGRMSDASSVIENCHNGNIDAATPTSLSVDVEMGGLPYIAGIAGHFMGNSLKNCGNHANITIKGKSGGYKDNKAPYSVPVFGGVIGYAKNSDLVVDNCDNLHNGDTEANHIAMNITFTTAGHIVFGGCFGSLDAVKSAANCDNNCAVTANITLSATEGSATTLGGLAGKMGAKATSCTNGPLGDITITGSAKANVGVSGLNCSTNATENCSNAGDIVMSVDQSAGGSAYINGLHWTGSGGAAHNNFTNSGNITYNGKCKVNVFMSGAGYTPTGTWTNVQNTGTLTANVTGLAAPLKIGGLARSSSTATFNGCGNSGDIVFKGTSTNAVYLGGLAGDINGAFKTAAEGYANTFVNSGDIKFLGTTTSTAYVGGVTGSASKDVGEVKVIKNTGLVTNYDAEEGLTGSAADLRIGGVLGNVSDAAFTHAVENSGNLYVRKAESAKVAYIGGVVGRATKTITGAKMTGDVAAIGFTESAAAPIVGVGMIIGSHRSSTAPQVSNCVIGGRLALEEMGGKPLYRTISKVEISVDDPNGDKEPDPNFIPYWEKIYGGTTEWELGSTYDGCTPDPSAPSEAPEA